MNQLSLFDQPKVELSPEVPNITLFRATLGATLRMLNRADILPWSENELIIKRHNFEELAIELPDNEGTKLLERFDEYVAHLLK